MKRVTLSLFLSFVVFAVSYAQDLEPRLGVGLQASFPAYGLSAKYNITEKHSAQAVLGFFGEMSSYYGRYLYNFKEKETQTLAIKPYLYGAIGAYSYTFMDVNTNYNSSSFGDVSEGTETSAGFGLGGGLEWAFNSFPDLKFSTEIGYSKVNLEYYDFKAMSFGVGIHYFFKLKK